jgi:hypothetical protein
LPVPRLALRPERPHHEGPRTREHGGVSLKCPSTTLYWHDHLSTRPNISESNSGTSTRVPLCIVRHF